MGGENDVVPSGGGFVVIVVVVFGVDGVTFVHIQPVAVVVMTNGKERTTNRLIVPTPILVIIVDVQILPKSREDLLLFWDNLLVCGDVCTKRSVPCSKQCVNGWFGCHHIESDG